MLFSSRVKRLGASGAVRLLLALLVVFAEAVLRMISFVIPSKLMELLDRAFGKYILPRRHLFQSFEGTQNVSMEHNTPELIDHYDYRCEEHMTMTKDGFYLTIHRVLPKEAEAEEERRQRPAVFLQHGLMQCSEVWVCFKEALAFSLVEAGYDVWLGNSRGNKYSCKHAKLRPHEPKFWDFSFEDMALYDAPACIDYVCKHTNQKQLYYIGFSQGTAVGFGCFSLMPHVAEKVRLFIALSPAAKARGLKQGMLHTLLYLAPQSIYLFFGTRAILASVIYWRRLMTRSVFARFIDGSNAMLFGWHSNNLGTMARKKSLYSHLFSLTSVKNVVHWFQIAAINRFQQYDENENFEKGYRGIQPQAFPVSQIACPMALFYGGEDKLTDIPWLIDQLPNHVASFCIPHYEHLDTLWATDADEHVTPPVLELLRRTEKNQPVDSANEIIKSAALAAEKAKSCS